MSGVFHREHPPVTRKDKIMELFNKFRKLQKVRFYVGLIAVGLVFSLISGFVIYKTAGITYETTQATVVHCEEFVNSTAQDDNDRYSYIYTINYTAGGKEYKDVEFGNFAEPKNPGDTVTIRYNVDDPEQLATEGGDYIIYIVLAVGIIAFIAGIIMLIKSLKQKSSELNEYDRVDLSKADPEKVNKIQNSTEPQNEYFFHFDGKMNQGYALEDKNECRVYEAQPRSFNLVKSTVFDFKNCLTGQTAEHTVGHTVSTSMNSGFGINTTMSSSFKIDGKNNWDYLADNGYSLDFKLEGIAPCYNVKHYGVDVAYIKTVGTNALRKKDSLIGKLPTNGLYSVQCRKSDLDMVFMVCFCISRTASFTGD